VGFQAWVAASCAKARPAVRRAAPERKRIFIFENVEVRRAKCTPAQVNFRLRQTSVGNVRREIEDESGPVGKVISVE
jgi:hypothetical protein